MLYKVSRAAPITVFLILSLGLFTWAPAWRVSCKYRGYPGKKEERGGKCRCAGLGGMALLLEHVSRL